jgi:hypothetical protein
VNPDKNSVAVATMEIASADVVAIAVEYWRLSTWLAGIAGNTGIARHAVRRLGDVLARWQVEVQSLEGRPFDAGLAAKVIDTVDDPLAPLGTDTVCETVSPMVICRGVVLRPAEVVVSRGIAVVRSK